MFKPINDNSAFKTPFKKEEVIAATRIMFSISKELNDVFAHSFEQSKPSMPAHSSASIAMACAACFFDFVVSGVIFGSDRIDADDINKIYDDFATFVGTNRTEALARFEAKTQDDPPPSAA